MAPVAIRGFTTAPVTTAGEAAELSGYSNIEFRIKEDAMVIDAVQQFAANNIGCLVTVNEAGMYQNILLEFLDVETLLLWSFEIIYDDRDLWHHRSLLRGILFVLLEVSFAIAFYLTFFKTILRPQSQVN